MQFKRRVGVKMSNTVQFLHFLIHFSSYLCWQATLFMRNISFPFSRDGFRSGRSDYDHLASERLSLKGPLLLPAQQDDHLHLALHWTGVPTYILIHCLNLWNGNRSDCERKDFTPILQSHASNLRIPTAEEKHAVCNINCDCHSRNKFYSWPCLTRNLLKFCQM